MGPFLLTSMTTAPVTARTPVPAPFDWPRIVSRWWPVALLGLVAYGKIAARVALEWTRNEDYSHGLIVPFVIAYLVYARRADMAKIPASPSNWGLPIMIGAQFINLVGVLGSEFFLQRTSLLMFAAGVMVYTFGWRWLRATSFAFALLFLAIPLPAIVFNSVALPLQFLASGLAERFLQLVSIPVYREGNVLMLATQNLNVAEACSGIRSLVSMVSLGLMLSYLVPLKWHGRAILLVSTVPIALAFNALRIGVTGVLAYHFGPRAAEGFFHSFSGWVMFVAAMCVLFGELMLLLKVFSSKQETAHA